MKETEPIRSEISIHGKTAEWLWSNIKKNEHLLDDAWKIHTLRGEERHETELRVLGFMQQMLYGNSMRQMIVSFKNDYYKFLKTLNNSDSCHREFTWLQLGDAPVDVNLYLGGKKKVRTLRFGRAHGMTFVIPLTEEGGEAFREKSYGAVEFASNPSLVADKRVIARWPDFRYFVYIGTLFHLTGLRGLEKSPGEVLFSPDVPQSNKLIAQLYLHLSKFMPELEIADDGKVRCKTAVLGRADDVLEESCSMPTLYGMGANQIGVNLLKGSGFEQFGTTRNSKTPKFSLNLSIINENKDNISINRYIMISCARRRLERYLDFQAHVKLRLGR